MASSENGYRRQKFHRNKGHVERNLLVESKNVSGVKSQGHAEPNLPVESKKLSGELLWDALTKYHRSQRPPDSAILICSDGNGAKEFVSEVVTDGEGSTDSDLDAENEYNKEGNPKLLKKLYQAIARGEHVNLIPCTKCYEDEDNCDVDVRPLSKAKNRG